MLPVWARKGEAEGKRGAAKTALGNRITER